MEKFDPVATIAESIWTALENGHDTDWQVPWHRTGFNLPRNATNGRYYRGINVIYLSSIQMAQNYSTNYWATYNAWQKVGGQVQKGEKSTIAVLFKPVTKKAVDGHEEGNKYWLLRWYKVFNADQQQGWNAPTPVALSEIERDQRADAMIGKLGASLQYGGDRAFYVPSQDRIQLPNTNQFKSTQDFYSTCFHEHGHWTGHESRLDRKLRNYFGDDEYAFEELIADMCGAFICAHLGIETSLRKDHIQYIGTWAKRMKADKKAFMTAASKAQSAFDYLLKHGGEASEATEGVQEDDTGK